MSYRQQTNHDGLWWQIALGIFVGQLMTAALAGVVAFGLGFFAFQGITRAVPEIRVPKRYAAPQQPTTPRPLEDGERCISHKRFRRLSNGWQELPNDPC